MSYILVVQFLPHRTQHRFCNSAMLHDRNQRGSDSVNLLSLYVHVQQCLYEFLHLIVSTITIFHNKYKLYILFALRCLPQKLAGPGIFFILYIYLYILLCLSYT